MSKIICDVCGTSYPETATQCPICGCVRSSDTVTVAGDTSEAMHAPSSYAHVKGGRFSKANVKKRNSGKPIYSAETVQKQTPRTGGSQGNQNSKNTAVGRTAPNKKTVVPATKKETPAGSSKKNETGLIVAIIVLLVAIAAVVIYIAVSYWGVDGDKGDKNNQSTTNTVQQTESTDQETEPTVQKIPCESLAVLPESIELTSVGESRQLEVTVLPATTTDPIVYASDDTEIADVDENGLVTIGNVSGTTKIIITCGDKVVECEVVCTIDEEISTNPSEGTEPSNPSTGYTEADLTFADNGWGYEYSEPTSKKSYNPYTGNIPAELVQFTSSDESIATVAADGTVTYLKAGQVEITAKYNGWEIKCKFIIY